MEVPRSEDSEDGQMGSQNVVGRVPVSGERRAYVVLLGVEH